MTMGLRTMLRDSQKQISPEEEHCEVPVQTSSSEVLEGTSDAPVELAKTTQHIMKYPVAKSTIETVQGSQHPRLVSPYMVQMRQSAPIKPLFEAVDTFNDGVLDQVDRMVPQLQTLEPQDIVNSITSPINRAREQSNNLTHTAEDTLNKRLVTPTRNFVSSFRDRYSSVLIDNNGKAIIRGQADPLVKPVNDYLEKFIDDHLTDGDNVPHEGFSNELSRSPRILLNGIQRSRPLVRSVPVNTTNHINELYQQNKAKESREGYLGPLRASLQTSSQLSLEAWNGFVSLLGFGTTAALESTN